MENDINISWKIYVDTLFKAQEKERELINVALVKASEILNLRFVAHDKEHQLLSDQLNKSEKIMDLRLDNMNQFIQRIDRMEATLATKELLQNAIRPLNDFQNRLIGIVLGASLFSSVVTALIIVLIKKWGS